MAESTAHGAEDFTRLAASVRVLCGVDLTQYRRGQMEHRVRTFAQRRGTPDLSRYTARLETDPAELDALLDRVTINVSQLWRHEDQWTGLARDVLPELAARGHIRAWCAGCSDGAEAYTLAAVCRDAAPAVPTTILGTDLDRRMIARARAGAFSAQDARSAPPAALERWFDRRHGGGWRAGSQLRAMVRFEVGDLLRMPIAERAFDLILCRNTVIYFTAPVRDELHARLAAALAPGGHLVVGTSERVAEPRRLGLAPSAPWVYRRGLPHEGQALRPPHR